MSMSYGETSKSSADQERHHYRPTRYCRDVRMLDAHPRQVDPRTRISRSASAEWLALLDYNFDRLVALAAAREQVESGEKR